MSEDTTITEKQLPNPQKFKWKNVAYYNTFEEASEHRAGLINEINVKIRRCGVDKSKFVVKVGTPVKVKSHE